MIELIILGGIVLLTLWVVLIYNGLVRLKNEVDNSFAQIDVQLKRRNDLIPNLVETVKGYAAHEKTVLENITKARSAIMQAKTVGEKAKASNMLSETLKSLFAVAENYPQLKANENFLQLQEEISGTENKIAYARQHYNDVVMEFDVRIQVFPNNIIAGSLGFSKKELFSTPEEERKVPKVKF
ncbi:MAG: LemA family protein [Candidatus Altiarchaeota archaeon]|nr:LemA family protein [Candidatus Altiarchaeota archaeon]MBU4436920.1 LemA family protein [Candidatus Altiarchaeota archaeon]